MIEEKQLIKKEDYDWETEMELNCLSQGFEMNLWCAWLRKIPSPFSWFDYKRKLERIINE